MAHSSFRPTDDRTVTGYSVKGDCIIASDRNYCVSYLQDQRKPVVFNNRIFNSEQDVTEKVIQELSGYASFDFTDIPKLAFLGKKGC
jgi:meiotically up-regulated gene 157 (Mug157) protein